MYHQFFSLEILFNHWALADNVSREIPLGYNFWFVFTQAIYQIQDNS